MTSLPDDSLLYVNKQGKGADPADDTPILDEGGDRGDGSGYKGGMHAILTSLSYRCNTMIGMHALPRFSLLSLSYDDSDDEYTNLCLSSLLRASFSSYIPHLSPSISLPPSFLISHYTLIIIIRRVAFQTASPTYGGVGVRLPHFLTVSFAFRIVFNQ